MNQYYHNSDECFCYYCGNNSLDNNTEMCEFCYDDNNLIYFCYQCSKYCKYNNINNICSYYNHAANIIIKLFKKLIS